MLSPMALKRYFHKLSFDLGKDCLWSDVHLGLEMDLSKFLETIRLMLMEKFKAVLFPKALQQAENTRMVGFLLYSYPSMDPMQMQQHLSELTRKEIVVQTKKFTKKGAFWLLDKSLQL